MGIVNFPKVNRRGWLAIIRKAYLIDCGYTVSFSVSRIGLTMTSAHASLIRKCFGNFPKMKMSSVFRFFAELLTTLVGFGVSGSVLTWLKSYLTDRYQCVRIVQVSSSPTFCHTGVPQGSVLGLMLFSCCISPISFIAHTFGVSIQQYADDTQLYIMYR